MFVETFQYLVLHKHFSFLVGFLVPCNVCPSGKSDFLNIKACALKPESQIFWDKNSIIPESLPASPPLTKKPEDSGYLIAPCSKSPHAHITERPRKHESEARVLIWRRTRFVRGRLITKILHLSERVTHLHIAVPTKTRFYASRIHVLKNERICKSTRSIQKPP